MQLKGSFLWMGSNSYQRIFVLNSFQGLTAGERTTRGIKGHAEKGMRIVKCRRGVLAEERKRWYNVRQGRAEWEIQGTSKIERAIKKQCPAERSKNVDLFYPLTPLSSACSSRASVRLALLGSR